MNTLITGTSRGLGLTIAKTLIEEGHTVYAISRTIGDLEKLKATNPDQVHHLSYDLSNLDDIKQIIFKDWLNGVEIHSFVNNAAMAYDTLLTNMDADKVLKMTKVNQLTPMLLTKYVIRNMLLHDVTGSIVHISSISAHTGYKGLSMYAATKGALEAFSKNTAREWGVKGIRSNCVACGFMETEMTDMMDDKTKQKVYNRTALKAPTSLESAAQTVVFLLSDKAVSITGEVMHVDGGTI